MAANPIQQHSADPFDAMFRRQREQMLRAEALWGSKPADGNRRLESKQAATATVTVRGVVLQVEATLERWKVWTEHQPLGYATARNGREMPAVKNVADHWTVSLASVRAGGMDVMALLSRDALARIRAALLDGTCDACVLEAA